MREAIRQGSRAASIDSFVNDGFFIFEVFRLRDQGFFGGGGFVECNMLFVRLEHWDLWQVTVISKEAFAASRRPEDVFLLENVEQILVSADNKRANAHQERRLFARMNSNRPLNAAGQDS